jgi:DNA-binding beta-propeller fold protein YncE
MSRVAQRHSQSPSASEWAGAFQSPSASERAPSGPRLLLRIAIIGVALATGCATTPKPIFPEISPPRVWPLPPDRPRIRYIGELRGEASLHRQAHGWEAVREFMAGPRETIAFSRPSAVAVLGDRVYVADIGLGGVHLLNLASREYAFLQGAPGDLLRVPVDLTIGEQRLVVVDRGRAALELFDLEGQWRGTRRWPEIKAPVAVTYDPASKLYWIADAELHAVLGTPDLQTLERRIGQRGAGPGQFNYPTALAARPPVCLAVADAMNFRVQLLDAAGLPAAVFGKKGDAAGSFARPRGIALDRDGHVYVVDNQFENVQVFDMGGRLLMAWGHQGNGPGEFALPAGITIDSQDRIWVADGGNGRVQVFQYLREESYE